ncbi:MAG: glycine zipper 2TM domain-containing protein [Pseudomonadota bacterium]
MTTSQADRKVHPLFIAAAIAVLLFCAIGIAAIMGWLPVSNGSARGPNDGALNAADRLASAPVSAPPVPVQAPRRAEAAPHRSPAPAREEPIRQAAVEVPALCTSCGVVESVRETTTRADGSGVGAAGGAVVGGLLGHQVGGGRGRDVATVLGAIGGAVAGNQIEGHVRATSSYDVTVRMNDGSTRTLHETAEPSWHAGDRVRLVDGVLRANG